MTPRLRIATRRDARSLLRVRAEWLDRFCQAHPAPERWCPAMAPVPRLENESTILQHLSRTDDHAWAAVAQDEQGIVGYILCRADPAEGKLVIERHNPRVSPGASADPVGGALAEFAVRHARGQGCSAVHTSVHGVPDEVEPTMALYRHQGFGADIRYEMLTRQLHVDPGPPRLEFRSAADVGPEAVCEVEAQMRGWAAAEVEKNLAVSRAMWSVADRDWLAAYEGRTPVGVVRMAATREGVGVVDAFGLAKEHRGRGLGIHLLAAGLARLAGQTDVVWLDVDLDNVPALRVYQRAGFQVHHLDGSMTLELG